VAQRGQQSRPPDLGQGCAIEQVAAAVFPPLPSARIVAAAGHHHMQVGMVIQLRWARTFAAMRLRPVSAALVALQSSNPPHTAS